MHSDQKLIIAGEFYHLYQYSTPIIYDIKQPNRPSAPKSQHSDVRSDNRSNFYRTKKAIKLLLQANTEGRHFADDSTTRPQFVTLTFAENISEVAAANRVFSKFVQNINYKIFKEKKAKLKYLAVIEFQKRGAIHYHVIFFNPIEISEFYDVVKEYWTSGYATIQKISSQQHLINYVHKDLTKLRQKKSLYGKKAYFCSRGLRQPSLYRQPLTIKDLLPNESCLQFSKTYTKDSVTTTYKCYKASAHN